MAAAAELRCRPGLCNHSRLAEEHPEGSWKLSATAYMEEMLPRLNVTDLVLNLGGHHWDPGGTGRAWEPASVGLARTRGLVAAAARAANASGGRVWWRTTTPRLRFEGRDALAVPWHRSLKYQFKNDDEATRMALGLGLRLFDAMHVGLKLHDDLPWQTRLVPLVWVPDSEHLVCSANRELNTLLLNMLCDPATLQAGP